MELFLSILILIFSTVFLLVSLAVRRRSQSASFRAMFAATYLASHVLIVTKLCLCDVHLVGAPNKMLIIPCIIWRFSYYA